MFKHILLPTDGSKLSEAAVFKGVELARQHQAKVTGLYVLPQFHILTYRVDDVEDTRDEFLHDTQQHARRYLDVVQRTADEARVPCTLLEETSDHPHEVICKVADERGCDLIVMASHGRHGVAGLILGSQTHRVLTHTKVAVLVLR